ncbi:unnamed protein product [Anisakis simplex]|uniref:Transcription initiation factor TFIID subunit 6 n=1 Tax=Anisakis simplex TaxID=6269 RepID=A0A0M3K8D6_ANISI|nr:unnamed protein product [Anisakis simplex]
MRTHPPQKTSKKKSSSLPSTAKPSDATVENRSSKRTTRRTSHTTNTSAAIQQPSSVFSSPTTSSEGLVRGMISNDEGGPAKHTRSSERATSESYVNNASTNLASTTESAIPKLRRSPRVQDSHSDMSSTEVWRSPRRRQSQQQSSFSTQQIKQESIDVGVDVDIPYATNPLQSTSNQIIISRTPSVLLTRRSPPLIALSSEDIHRREGSTETMAMCEESSDPSLLDSDTLNELNSNLITNVSNDPAPSIHNAFSSIHKYAKTISNLKTTKNLSSDAPGTSQLITPGNVSIRNAGKPGSSKSRLDHISSSRLATNDEPQLIAVPRKRKKFEHKSSTADVSSLLHRNDSISKSFAPKKKGSRRGAAGCFATRSRDPIAESIPPLKNRTPDECMEVATRDEETAEISADMIYNFAQSMSVPIHRSDFSDENTIDLLKDRLLMVLREVIDASKLFALEARREQVTAHDLNAFMRYAHLPPLYGFMEDENWLKIGDVFVPNEKAIQLSSFMPSVRVSAERLIDFKCTMAYANR